MAEGDATDKYFAQAIKESEEAEAKRKSLPSLPKSVLGLPPKVSDVVKSLYLPKPPARNVKSISDFVRSAAGDVVDGMVPTNKDALGRLFTPSAGSYGPSRGLEDLGQKVSDSVESSVKSIRKKSPLVGLVPPINAVLEGSRIMSKSLSPSGAQEFIGPEAGLPMLGKMGAASPAIKTIGKALGRGAARVGQFLSGIKPSSYERLAKNPSVMLPPGVGGPPLRSTAGKALGDAVGAADASLAIDPTRNAENIMKKSYQKATEDIPSKYLNDEATLKAAVKRLSPEEAYEGLRSTNEVLKGMVEGKNSTLFRDRVIFKNALKEHMSELSGEYAKASKNFADAALRDEFTNILPTTKYGTPSIGRAGFSKLLGLPFAVNSPILHGAITAAGSAAVKGASNILKNPAVRQILFQTAKKKNE